MLRHIDIGILLACVTTLIGPSIGSAQECSGISCDDNAECIILPGVPPSCRCSVMFQGNGTFCEAATCENGIRCGSNAICSIEHESFQCTCIDGYAKEGNGLYCNDIDECATSIHDCDVNADCKNTVGSYECECKTMYFGNGTFCQEKTCENSNPCGLNTNCVRNSDDFDCNCKPGYVGAISCTDIDECSSSSTNDCDVNASCQNTEGSYICTCNSMYFGNGTYCERKTCENSKPCGEHTICKENANDFDCDCMEGYEGAISCSDIDECASAADTCHPEATCENTDGSFTCRCKDGYTGDGTKCDDIDECALASDNNCDANAVCSNTVGSYECKCKTMYSGNATYCEDLNECSSSSTNDCDVNASCQNNEGSYTCTCNSMYFGNGTYCERKTCENSKPCGEHTICKENANDFDCDCMEGYEGAISCSDIDECASAADTCHPEATCENTDGSFTCRCKDGYTGDGITCEDFDECARISGNDCDTNAVCSNTVGSYECACKTMYTGNGTYCEEKTCENSKPCGENAECQATKSNFVCTCFNGYTGAIACTDIDECAEDSANNCNENAVCTNTDGSYNCVCKDGFMGDGTYCEESLPSRAECSECPTTSHCEQGECVCNTGFRLRDNEGCIGYCDASIMAIESISFHFDGNFEGGVSFSKEKCNATGRSIASATCTDSGTGSLFSFDMIQSVGCNETVSSVAKQINWNDSSIEELEEGISRLAVTVSSGSTLSKTDRSVFIENAALGAASLQMNRSDAISEQTLRQIVVAANSVAESFAETASKGYLKTDNVTVARLARTLRHSVEIFSAKSSFDKPVVSVVTPNIRAQVQNDLDDNASEYTYSSPTMRIIIPREAVEQAKAKGTLAANRLVVLEYSGKTLFQSSENLTRVITVELGIGSEITDLSKDVIFYPGIPEQELADQPIPGKLQTKRVKLLCSYYVPEKLSFSQGGCRLLQNTSEPVCACDHMTSFSALLEYEVIDDDIVLSIFTTVGCIISSVALFIALVMHATGRNKKEKRQISLSINAYVCASLLMVYLTFVVGISQTHVYGVCLGVTALLHYLLLLTWSWTTVYSYAMFNSLVRLAPEKLERRFLVKATFFAYGLPLIIVGTTLLVKFLTEETVTDTPHHKSSHESRMVLKGYMAPNMCWLAGDSLKFGYLLPAGILLLGNYFVFSYLVYCLTRQRIKMQSVSSRKNATREVVASLSMATTLGLTWIFGYMMLISSDRVYRNILAWLFTIMTVLQGLLLFTFTLMRRATLRDQIFSSVKTRFSTISFGLSVRMKSVRKVKRTMPSNLMTYDDEDSGKSSSDSYDTNSDQQSSTKSVSGLVSFSTCDSSTVLQ